MCHHYNKVAHDVYIFAHDEKLNLAVCLKFCIDSTKNRSNFDLAYF